MKFTRIADASRRLELVKKCEVFPATADFCALRMNEVSEPNAWKSVKKYRLQNKADGTAVRFDSAIVGNVPLPPFLIYSETMRRDTEQMA